MSDDRKQECSRALDAAVARWIEDNPYEYTQMVLAAQAKMDALQRRPWALNALMMMTPMQAVTHPKGDDQ